jgi:CRISPR-associated protein Csb2
VDALSFAERVHAALVSLSDGSPVFTGCDDSGKPLEGHRHAYILCESIQALGKGERGEITHILIFAPMGFGDRECKALEGFSEVWRNGEGAVQLILMGIGRREDFAGLDLDAGRSPLLAESKSWVSRTPFVPTRHPKRTRKGAPKRDERGLQKGSPEHELRRLLGLAGFPEPVAVEHVRGTSLGGREVPWASFVCRRESGEGRRAANGVGYGFRIEFPEAVQGPVAVGYGAHFGMGGFEGG